MVHSVYNRMRLVSWEERLGAVGHLANTAVLLIPHSSDYDRQYHRVVMSEPALAKKPVPH